MTPSAVPAKGGFGERTASLDGERPAAYSIIMAAPSDLLAIPREQADPHARLKELGWGPQNLAGNSKVNFVLLAKADDCPPLYPGEHDSNEGSIELRPWLGDDVQGDSAAIGDAIAEAALRNDEIYLDMALLGAGEALALFVGTDVRVSGSDGSQFTGRLEWHALDRPKVLGAIDRVDAWLADSASDVPKGIGSFVVRTSPPKRSRVLDLYSRALADGSARRPYKAMVEFLEERAELNDDARLRKRAADLSTRIDHWVNQRLWSLNCVPELVVHDDRHVERVDHLATSLARHLIGKTVRDIYGQDAHCEVTENDLEILSMAAWLHDWGLVGGRIQSLELEEEPLRVRYLHGLITQSLLSDRETEEIHRIQAGRDRRLTGVLCAHHQGWTSFYKEVPDGGMSLESDLENHRIDDAPLAKVALLLAILRVADAADMGRHRVPELMNSSMSPGEAEDDAKHQFLLMRVRHYALRLAQQISDPKLREAALKEASAFDPLTRQDQIKSVPQFHPLYEYIEFIRKQRKHYLTHLMVEYVRFAVQDVENGISFKAIVEPSVSLTDEAKQRAIGAVEACIRDELMRPPGVRLRLNALLARNGVFFRGAERA